jgi:hypothetical protein
MAVRHGCEEKQTWHHRGRPRLSPKPFQRTWLKDGDDGGASERRTASIDGLLNRGLVSCLSLRAVWSQRAEEVAHPRTRFTFEAF